MNEIWRDVRLALKAIPRERAFSATVLLTLAIVIGANVAIFSVIRTVLLEPLPYEDPDELVTIYNSYPGAGVEEASNGTYDFFMRRARVEAFEEVALLDSQGRTVGDPGSTERIPAARVTPSLFPLLRVQAALGRTFTEDEMEPGNGDKLILTDGFWREYFGGSPDIVGREVRVDGSPYTVVGVLPPDFRMVDLKDARFFTPVTFSEAERSAEAWHSNSFGMMARLRDGASVGLAQAQNDALNEQLIDESPIPNARQLMEDVRFATIVRPTHEVLVGDVRPTLYMLWAGVGFVLLIGCVNIANLMLARSQIRMTEIATRLAVGAPRARVAQQIVTESLVLSFLGGAAGVLLGIVGLRLLTGIGLDQLPRGADIGVDIGVLGFTVLVVLLTGILFAALPAIDVLRRDLSGVFRAASRSATASRGTVLLRNSLVTGQVALAFVLLVGAGLMLMSFRAALSVDPGFAPEGVITAAVSLPATNYPNGDARRNFTDEMMREIAAIPGIASASVTSQMPFGNSSSSSVIFPEGYTPQQGESLISPFQSLVGPDYFETMGIQIVEGREFEWSDGPESTNVMVIDEWLARRFWPDQSPLGRRMVANSVPGDPDISEDDYYTIIGVVESIKHNDLTSDDAAHAGAYYFTTRQLPAISPSIVARAQDGVDPASLTNAMRQTISGLDPELPLFDVQTMTGRIDESLANRRAPMTLLLVFSGVALFLAIVGIYGALAYAVARRRREMGIRMALGSAPGDIFTLVLRHGVAVAVVGLAIGFVGSAAMGGLMGSLLFGVRPLDPLVIAGVAAILGAAAVAACAVPAWTATRVDPLTTLAPE